LPVVARKRFTTACSRTVTSCVTNGTGTEALLLAATGSG
jgi:hypothetical protein